MIFAVPVVLYIEAETFDDAQKIANEWGEEVQSELPEGVDGVETSLTIDYNEDGDRVALLPADDTTASDEDEDDDLDDLEVDEGSQD